MPKGQLLFSAVFGFRNPSKEIFSESDEIKTEDLIIPGSFQSTGEGREGSQGAPHHTPARARGGAPPYGLGTPWPLRLPLGAYLSLPDLKTPPETTIRRKTFQSRRHREIKIRGTELSVPAPRRDGELPPEAVSTAIFTAIAVPMMRRE